MTNKSTTTTPITMTTVQEPRNGYDLSVHGLDDGQFYFMHVPALVLISLSLICVVMVLIMSCRRHRNENAVRKQNSSFYKWSKGERFVVYLCICDGLFGVFHFVDHTYILVIRDNVHPRQLCQFYGFMLIEFIGAQIFLANLIAVNAFLLIFFRRNIKFGVYDYKLLLWTFGMPFIVGCVCIGFDSLGPNGYFCFFDAVKGEVANVLISSVFLTLVLLLNIVLYILTWYRIRREEFNFKSQENNETLKASHRAARSMGLFVAAFVVQYWAMALYGIWQLQVKDVPQFVFQCGTVFTNCGGILNGIVYLILRKQRQGADRSKISDKYTYTDTRTPSIKAKSPDDV